jgi:hypothetical protein
MMTLSVMIPIDLPGRDGPAREPGTAQAVNPLRRCPPDAIGMQDDCMCQTAHINNYKQSGMACQDWTARVVPE